MNDMDRDFNVSRIRAGFTKVGDIRVFPPTPEVEYEANIIAREIMADDSIIESEDMLALMYESRLWSTREEEEIKIAERHIDHFKTDIFNNFFNERYREQARLHLRAAETHLFSLLNKRASFESYTRSGIATYSKNLYIFTYSSFYPDGSMVDWSTLDVTSMMGKYSEIVLGPKLLRLLARTTPWTSFWSIYKKGGGSLFQNKNLTFEQQQLIQWSSLYDSIHESTDCPLDEIISDDDGLDGWLIIQNNKRKKHQNENMFSNNNSNFGKHGENYIPASSKEEAERVMSLNSPQSLAVMQSRMRQVEKHGVLKEHQLADVKQNIMMAANSTSIPRG